MKGSCFSGAVERLFQDDIGLYQPRVPVGCGEGCSAADSEYNPAASQKFGLPGYSDRTGGSWPKYGSRMADTDDYSPVSIRELSRRVISEPDFQGRGGTIEDAREAYRPIVERINGYLAEEKGAVLSYGDLKVKEMKPTYIVSEDGRIAKVLGLYNTLTNEIFLSSDLKGGQVSEVLEHELLHYVQDKFGVIARYLDGNQEDARARIERDVERTQDYINRKYPLEGMPPQLKHRHASRPSLN